MVATTTITETPARGPAHTDWLCEAHAAERIARQALRTPQPHEHSATTRKGTGRFRYTVAVRRLTPGAAIDCTVCTAPTTDELNAYLRGEL